MILQLGGRRVSPPGSTRRRLLCSTSPRLVAFVVAGEMAVAYFMAHAPGSLYPIKNHGELAVVLCFVFLYLAVAGGGRLSVDAVWRG